MSLISLSLGKSKYQLASITAILFVKYFLSIPLVTDGGHMNFTTVLFIVTALVLSFIQSVMCFSISEGLSEKCIWPVAFLIADPLFGTNIRGILSIVTAVIFVISITVEFTCKEDNRVKVMMLSSFLIAFINPKCMLSMVSVLIALTVFLNVSQLKTKKEIAEGRKKIKTVVCYGFISALSAVLLTSLLLKSTVILNCFARLGYETVGIDSIRNNISGSGFSFDFITLLSAVPVILICILTIKNFIAGSPKRDNWPVRLLPVLFSVPMILMIISYLLLGGVYLMSAFVFYPCTFLAALNSEKKGSFSKNNDVISFPFEKKPVLCTCVLIFMAAFSMDFSGENIIYEYITEYLA